MSYVRCDRCDGSGEVNCPKCNSSLFSAPGSQFVLIGGEEGAWDPCDHCDASGNINCPDCGGSGEVKEEEDDDDD